MVGFLRQDVAVSRGENDFETGPTLANAAGEVQTVHAWHDDVGEDEIDLVAGGVQHLERSLTVLNPRDDLSQFLQEPARELADRLVVLDKQDALCRNVMVPDVARADALLPIRG